ncbi:sigma-54-dependent Fis family transcriptional regulator [Massilia violaceinigra]|uniref:Sigma-54-dependent Fis family transcriptional regulator n=1 Tax=Massilia violaceinigra TaxID=2045208 RepID=A0ABY4ABG9_9BURK|nr:sigma-54 dependent transcriptional regulator [Massilia violaceinigra]UOD32132.1 sigma-54-dependent Fis family transcriptional regulator [Massilia violaceinigra]
MADHPARILILDDDADVAYAAALVLRGCAGKVATLADPRQLARHLHDGVPEVVLLDFNFTPGRTDGAEGLAVLDQLRALPDPPLVIVMTAYADVALAVEAMKRGASDFLTKPWDNARLLAVVQGALAQRASPAAPAAPGDPLMGDSLPMRQLRALIASVGPTQANVMVLGENGVGKELAARAIHLASRRAAGQFLAVDMGSLPEATLESELFGHRKGSFTDARSDRAGRFQAASGGTLFLDEIGNLALGAQSKLLTALERREVTPLGADRPQAIDVRIVSATNLDEARLYDAQVFRPDLLFRLNTIVLRVPPLRERRADIPALLRHYLAHYRALYGKAQGSIAPDAFDALCAHHWPGNVRALRHACERAVILGQPGAYGLADFGLHGGEPASVAHVRAAGTDMLALDTIERDAVAAAMAQARGNISHAAILLGISRAALYRKRSKHGL